MVSVVCMALFCAVQLLFAGYGGRTVPAAAGVASRRINERETGSIFSRRVFRLSGECCRMSPCREPECCCFERIGAEACFGRGSVGSFTEPKSFGNEVPGFRGQSAGRIWPANMGSAGKCRTVMVRGGCGGLSGGARLNVGVRWGLVRLEASGSLVVGVSGSLVGAGAAASLGRGYRSQVSGDLRHSRRVSISSGWM